MARHTLPHRSQTESRINNDTHQQFNNQHSVSRHINQWQNRENAQIILEREIQLKRLRDERRKE